MRYIMEMGSIWKVNENFYKKLTADIKAGKEIDLDEYGSLLIADPIKLQHLIQMIKEDQENE